MSESCYFIFDEKYYSVTENIISVNNRAFKYGDGFFETIKLTDGKIQLKNLHFERIKQSFKVLQFSVSKNFSFDNLETQILKLVKKNNQLKSSRIRITFFRKESELFDVKNFQPSILIQSFHLIETENKINENGLSIDIYPIARKSCDVFSSIKSNNYLPYTMAAIWAKENKLNDAIILNCFNRIADSTIANLFIIKNNIIKTPALAEGCISGVMRKYIIEKLHENKITVIETSITEEEIFTADELFLTNAIKGISWVKSFKNKKYDYLQIKKINQLLFNN